MPRGEQSIWDKGATVLLVVSAAAVAGVLVHREFFASPSRPERPKPAYFAQWREALAASHTTGNADATVSIVEISDLECPFCKKFHGALQDLRSKHPGAVSYSFVHFPLAAHSHALAAARAAECAGQQGRFAEAVDVIFADQESFGKRDWTWYARRADVKDTSAFAHCMTDTTTPPLVQKGLALGTRIKVTGTPTVFLNGWRYNGAPPDSEIIRAVEDLLAGKRPYKDFPEKAIKAP